MMYVGQAPLPVFLVGVLVLLFECWAIPTFIREATRNGKKAQK